MQTLLITGGCGFIGSNLATRFKAESQGLQVIAFDNLKRRGSELNLPRLRASGVEFIHGDIRNSEDLSAVGPFDCIIECSAEPSALAGYNSSPQYVINANLAGTINCLEAARKCRADFIFLSTSRVYPIGLLRSVRMSEGETRFQAAEDQDLPGISPLGISELFPLNGPRTMYGATKLASELLVQEYNDMYGLRGFVDRCGVIAGAWQMGKVEQGVVSLWVAKHLWPGELAYLGFGGAGKQVRDLLSVDDLYRLVALQMKAMDSINGQVFNVGGGANFSVSLLELTELCQQLTGNRVTIGSVEETREGDVPYYVSDCRLLQKYIDWEPSKSPQDIVLDVFHWLVANESSVRPILTAV